MCLQSTGGIPLHDLTSWTHCSYKSSTLSKQGCRRERALNLHVVPVPDSSCVDATLPIQARGSLPFFSLCLHLLHHLHDDSPGAGQDQVTDSPVVLGEDVQPIHRHHKLAHLEKEKPRDRPYSRDGFSFYPSWRIYSLAKGNLTVY